MKVISSDGAGKIRKKSKGFPNDRKTASQVPRAFNWKSE
jgi:hypothetical protein